MAKKYDIYGIGNALVDIEVEVENSWLSENKIEKGVMTLVEEDKQKSLMEAALNIKKKMQCGGSAANTIIGASQFGANCYYSCKVANDEEGKFYMEDLKSNGVETNLTTDSLPEGITGKCLVMVTPDAERTLNTFLGITSNYSSNEINELSLRDSNYLYIEGYLITSESGREAMKKAKKMAEENNVKVALTFSDPSMVKYFRDEMEEVVGASVDMLFCNEEEACLFTGRDSLEEAREKLKKSAKRFAITLGSNGAMIYDGDTFIDIEPYQVKAVDSNGAGDMFAGAFLYGITNGHTYASSGKLASLASSKIVSQFGPRLEWHQAKEVLNSAFR